LALIGLDAEGWEAIALALEAVRYTHSTVMSFFSLLLDGATSAGCSRSLRDDCATNQKILDIYNLV